MSEGRFALVIATSTYADNTIRQLIAPANDVVALTSVLKDPKIGDFNVTAVVDKPNWEVKTEIERFLTHRTPNDLALIYFSGHGIKGVDGELYFATTNTDPKLLRSTSVEAAFLNDLMRLSKPRRQVLLLDCCYSGAFARGMIAKGDNSIGVNERFQEQGRLVLTASNAMQYAFEGTQVTGGNTFSFFTSAVVEGLSSGRADQGGDGYVSFDELYHYVYENVTARVPEQRPMKWTFGLQGDVIIATNPYAPPIRPRRNISPAEWKAPELPWADGTTMLLLPFRSHNDTILCIGKYPITNVQYKKFVKDTSASEPKGTGFGGRTQTGYGKWEGTLYPWRDNSFNKPDQPVVCVSLNDALSYCDWVNTTFTVDLHPLFGAQANVSTLHPPIKTRLPSSSEWIFATFGIRFPSSDPALRFTLGQQQIHDKALAPAEIDHSGIRSNMWGISDMLGNVWEWCTELTSQPSDEDGERDVLLPGVLGLPDFVPLQAEARGGGFIDDLARLKEIAVDKDRLSERENTRHSDLGFRVAGEIPIMYLPGVLQKQLERLRIPPIDSMGDSVIQADPAANGFTIGSIGRLH